MRVTGGELCSYHLIFVPIILWYFQLSKELESTKAELAKAGSEAVRARILSEEKINALESALGST